MAEKRTVIEHSREGIAARQVVAEGTAKQTAQRALLAAHWRDTVENLSTLGEHLSGDWADPDDRQMREELFRLTYSTIAQGYIGLLHADPRHPDFWPIWNQAFNTIDPNPDNVYYMSPVDDSGVYRISGTRGTVHCVSLLIGSGEFLPYGRGTFGPTLADYQVGRDVPVQPNGQFEVVLSATRPPHLDAHWLPLPATSSFINVRQIAYDWEHEEDGRLAIERLDVPAIKPRLTAEEIAQKLRQIPIWAANVTQLSAGWYRSLVEQGLVNRIAARDLSGAGGLKNQAYMEGTFDLQPDEALIIDTDLPETASYWAFQLTDSLFVSIDYLHRQTSLNGSASSHLNGYSARVDADGRFRAVVSAADPGVPNWLDTAGYRTGTFFGRWFECNRYPQPTVVKIKLAELRSHLPPDTPHVSPEQRDAALRLRRRAAQLRKRW